MTTTGVATTKTNVRGKDVDWYCAEPGDKLGVLARELLEKYSRIPPEEVESHVKEIV
jgi:hypothetical protein